MNDAGGSYEANLTVLGHIQSGVSPTSFDRMLASRLPMILLSDEDGSAIYVASSPRRIQDGPSVVRGGFPLEMVLDAALTSASSNEHSAWARLIG